MTRDELIKAALAFDGAVEEYPFGDRLLTVKVGGAVADEEVRQLITLSYRAVVATLPKRRPTVDPA